MFASSLSIKLVGTLEFVDQEPLYRAFGIVMGSLIVVMGNFTPKVLGPLASEHCAGQSPSVQRFSGWIFVLTGLVFIAAWVFLPESQARTVSNLVCLSTVVLVLLRWAVAIASTKMHSSSSPDR
jgi:hypothetical protein